MQPDLEILNTSISGEYEEEPQEKTIESRGQLHYTLEYEFNKEEVGNSQISCEANSVSGILT